jgi:hypothetical protein
MSVGIYFAPVANKEPCGKWCLEVSIPQFNGRYLTDRFFFDTKEEADAQRRKRFGY